MKQQLKLIAAPAFALLAFVMFWEFYHARSDAKRMEKALIQACESFAKLAPFVQMVPGPNPLNPESFNHPFYVNRGQMERACEERMDQRSSQSAVQEMQEWLKRPQPSPSQ